MDEPRSFGSWLREHRRTLDLSRQELARRVSCAVITIKKIETGERRPSRQLAELILDVLAIPPEQRPALMRLARATPLPIAALPQPAGLALEDLSGRAIRGYTLLERLGIGGFGAVYRAEQPGIGRAVAIKIILSQYANQPEFIRRFETEAQIIARLEHPHIVPLYDYWREPGGAYLVMRYISGGTLHSALQQGALPLGKVAWVLEQIGAALHFAHRAGVVHRDLKPSNILVDSEGNAYLADFGIAKALDSLDVSAPQTQPGAIVGSPAYLSPEQITDDPVTPRSDIYSLGVMLYELLTGVKPFQAPTPAGLIQQHISQPLPSLRTHRPDLPEALDAIIQRATDKRPDRRYPDVPALLVDFRHLAAPGLPTGGTAVVTQQDSEYVTALLDLPDQTNPYRGLRAFGEADAALFFGRDALVARLLERMAEDLEPANGVLDAPDQPIAATARFLAVVGPSGSGKSSVVKAGLIPALRRGGLPGSERWFIAEMLPGAHPFEELELALLRLAPDRPANLNEQLARDQRGLLRASRLILPPDGESELLLLIDQFEELFTLLEDEHLRERFLANLVAAVTDARSRVRVIVTLRADFYDRPLLSIDLGALVRARTEVILPLNSTELEQAIAGPAQRAGLALEPGLVPAIVRDVGEQPGALPLLQYALTELFERRNGRMLTLAAYREIGGVAGALARRADSIYDGLSLPEQELARQLFLRLVTPGEGVEDTRRRVRISELGGGDANLESRTPASVASILDRFGQARLLTFDRDPLTREPTVEVAHEALIRSWSRLRAWLDATREDLRVQRRLTTAANEWIHAGQDASFLASGARLAQFAALAEAGGLALNDRERAYLQTSLAERDRRAADERERQARELDQLRALAEEQSRVAVAQRSAARRLRSLVVALGLFLIVAIGLSLFAFEQRNAAQLERDNARAERNRAEQSARLALAHELAAASINSMGADPQRSILLALQAVTTTYAIDRTWTLDAEEALHRALAVAQPRLILRGHRSGVYDAAFSPDGASMATASLDGTVKIWDAHLGTERLTLETAPGAGSQAAPTPAADAGHGDHGAPAPAASEETRAPSDIYSVAYSPDGAHLATGGRAGRVYIWDVANGRQLLTLQVTDTTTPTAIADVVYSPDGERLAAADIGGHIRVWDLASGQVLLSFSNQQEQITFVDFSVIPNHIAFSPDGARLAGAGPNNTAKIWDAATGQELLALAGHTSAVLHVAFSPDGSQIATASYDATARIWDAMTGRALATLIGHTSWLAGTTFSPDGARLATTGNDGTIKVWDLAGKELFTLAAHASAVRSVAFSPDGARLLSASADATTRVWDASPSYELFTLTGHRGDVFGGAFSPDGTRLVTAGTDGIIKIWDAANGQLLLALTGHTGAIEGVVFSPDGRRIASGSWDSTAKIWDATTGALLMTLAGHTNQLGQVAFSPDGKHLATTSYDQTVKIWDTATGKQMYTLSGHTGGVHCVFYSPDGTRLITGGDDKVAIVWDLATRHELFRLPIQTNTLSFVVYNPDGTRLVTADADETAEIWDAATGRLLMSLAGHAGAVWSVTYSPDGTRIATGSADRTTKIWDAATGELLLTLYGHAGSIWGVAFSPDARRLATNSADGTARLYVLPIEELAALARSRLTRSWLPEECRTYLRMQECPPVP